MEKWNSSHARHHLHLFYSLHSPQPFKKVSNSRKTRSFPFLWIMLAYCARWSIFQGVLIGKKTDKFYLLKKGWKEEKFMAFVLGESEGGRRKKSFSFAFPTFHCWQETNDNIRLITEDLSVTERPCAMSCVEHKKLNFNIFPCCIPFEAILQREMKIKKDEMRTENS